MTVEDNDTEAMEYVLGLLDREDRRRFEAALLDDPALAEAVWRAEEQLVPLAEAVRQRTVPPRVKRGLEARIFGVGRKVNRRDRKAARFWRNVSGVFAAATIAGVALVTVLAVKPDLIVPPSQEWIAAIVQPDGTVTLARLRDDGALVAEPFPIEASGSPELWVVPEGGDPVSLGLLQTTERSTIEVPRALDALFRQGSRLVITLEPEGGSPTGKPTGPAVGAGPLTQI